jgi:hypothetical protein
MCPSFKVDIFVVAAFFRLEIALDGVIQVCSLSDSNMSFLLQPFHGLKRIMSPRNCDCAGVDCFISSRTTEPTYAGSESANIVCCCKALNCHSSNIVVFELLAFPES